MNPLASGTATNAANVSVFLAGFPRAGRRIRGRVPWGPSGGLQAWGSMSELPTLGYRDPTMAPVGTSAVERAKATVPDLWGPDLGGFIPTSHVPHSLPTPATYFAYLAILVRTKRALLARGQ